MKLIDLALLVAFCLMVCALMAVGAHVIVAFFCWFLGIK